MKAGVLKKPGYQTISSWVRPFFYGQYIEDINYLA
jgi:hypothetical protein